MDINKGFSRNFIICNYGRNIWIKGKEMRLIWTEYWGKEIECDLGLDGEGSDGLGGSGIGIWREI